MALVGLEGHPVGARGFQYLHSQSGFIFELRPAPPSCSEASDGEEDAVECEEELEYNPISLGSASEVR